MFTMKTLIVMGEAALCLASLPACTVAPAGAYSPERHSSPPAGRTTDAAVNLLHTNHERWAYDPYRRSYYDNVTHRYYDQSNRRYHSSAPTRYRQARYPSGYRRGHAITCPDHLPYLSSSRGQGGSGHRGYGHARQKESLKDAYKQTIDRENAEFEAMMDRRKATFKATMAAETRAFKSRPRTDAEKYAYKRRWAEMERQFKIESEQLKARHKAHVEDHILDYKLRTR